MIANKLYCKIFFKSNFLRVFRFVSLKRIDSKSLQNQVRPTSVYQTPLLDISSNMINLRSNYSSGDKASSLYSGSELIEFEQIKDLLKKCLDNAIIDQHIHQGSLVSNSVIQQFCNAYSALSPKFREKILLYICCNYSVEHNKVLATCEALLKNNKADTSSVSHLQPEERLRYHLQPIYSHLFRLIGRLTNGVKFLTEMRNDALDYASNSTNADSVLLRDFSNQLKSILSIWFSVGLLKLTRITWETPADILEKIAKDEAVHSVRSWTDLKKRLGPNRRCYAFFHSSMPRVPLLLLHVALTSDITANITDIVDHTVREIPRKLDACDNTTAMFYSITSTQRGLQGIEFGIYMIRAVVQELQRALPNFKQFSSLSPIPRFSFWLQGQISQAMKENKEIFLPHEVTRLTALFGCHSDVALAEQVLAVLMQGSWIKDSNVVEVLKEPLLRLCAEYLYNVKSRGNAFDPVANFHLRNGATMWRINWMADPSAKGLNQSFGMMVNYRYFLNEIEENSRQYILRKKIPVSEAVSNLISRKMNLKSPL